MFYVAYTRVRPLKYAVSCFATIRNVFHLKCRLLLLFFFLVYVSSMFSRTQISSLCRHHTIKMICSQSLCFMLLIYCWTNITQLGATCLAFVLSKHMNRKQLRNLVVCVISYGELWEEDCWSIKGSNAWKVIHDVPTPPERPGAQQWFMWVVSELVCSKTGIRNVDCPMTVISNEQ